LEDQRSQCQNGILRKDEAMNKIIALETKSLAGSFNHSSKESQISKLKRDFMEKLRDYEAFNKSVVKPVDSHLDREYELKNGVKINVSVDRANDNLLQKIVLIAKGLKYTKNRKDYDPSTRINKSEGKIAKKEGGYSSHSSHLLSYKFGVNANSLHHYSAVTTSRHYNNPQMKKIEDGVSINEEQVFSGKATVEFEKLDANIDDLFKALSDKKLNGGYSKFKRTKKRLVKRLRRAQKKAPNLVRVKTYSCNYSFKNKNIGGGTLGRDVRLEIPDRFYEKCESDGEDNESLGSDTEPDSGSEDSNSKKPSLPLAKKNQEKKVVFQKRSKTHWSDEERKSRILGFMKKAPEKEYSQADLKRGIGRQPRREYLDSLVRQGFLHKASGKKYKL